MTTDNASKAASASDASGASKGAGPAKSVQDIEADIVAARQRLAGTVDELHHRTAPKEVARRQAESAKVKFNEATRTESGDLRTERIAALAAAAVALIGLGAWRRRRG
jgi:Protein of unknown function (DUF3618)